MAHHVQVAEEFVEWLLWEHGIDYDHRGVSASVAQVQTAYDSGEIDWFELVTAVCAEYGVRTRSMTLSVDLLARTRRFFPIYCYLSDDKGWLSILERRRGRYRIAYWSEASGEVWLTKNELLSWMGVDVEQELTWFTTSRVDSMSAWKKVEDNGKKPDVTSTWHRLRGLVLSERKELFNLVLYAMGIGLFSLATPVAVQSLVNTVAFGTLLQPLVVLSLMLSVGLVFMALMQAMQIYLAEMISRRVFARVVADFAHRLPRIKAKVFQKKNRTEVGNYFFDVLTVQKVLAVLVFDGLTSVLVIGSGLLLLALYHPVLLVFDFLLILAILGVIYFFGRGAIQSGIKESKTKHKIGAWLNQLLYQPLLHKANHHTGAIQGEAEALTRSYLRTRQSHFSILMRQVIAGLVIQVIASTGLLLVGGWLVIKQQLTLGQLVAAELIVSALVASLFKVVKMFEKFYDLMAALDKLGTVVDLEMEQANGDLPSPLSGPVAVEFSDVCVTSSLGQQSLEQFNLSILPGQHLAIVGNHERGKTVIGDLLFGLQRADKGQIRLGDAAVRELHLAGVRQQVALVREVSFVEGSLFDNLRMGNPEIRLNLVREALGRVGLLHDILAMPEGLDTVLSQDGFPLTPTQQRLLVLARAMVREPNVLVIDGVLDTLAPHNLAELFHSLCRHSERDWTLLCLTHRNEIADACDVVMSLDNDSFTVLQPQTMGA